MVRHGLQCSLMLVWRVARQSVFFFFQAEDGIRDYKVTGVQTCALPIWKVSRVPASTSSRPIEGLDETVGDCDDPVVLAREAVSAGDGAVVLVDERSEERRVGEEGRSRWAPDH